MNPQTEIIAALVARLGGSVSLSEAELLAVEHVSLTLARNPVSGEVMVRVTT